MEHYKVEELTEFGTYKVLNGESIFDPRDGQHRYLKRHWVNIPLDGFIISYNTIEVYETSGRVWEQTYTERL
jgi:hypothetical protein